MAGRQAERLSKGRKRREIYLLCKLKQLNVLLDQNPQDTKLAIEAERIRYELQNESLNIKLKVRL